jgi:hypothetical protein
MDMTAVAWRAWVAVTVMVTLLANCAAPRPSREISIKAGAPWREVARVGGHPTVIFSYVKGGRKYDLATLQDSPNPVVFENSRLFAVLPPDAVTEFDRKMEGHLKTVELPFENGVGDFHSWILVQRGAFPKPAEPSATTAGDVGEAAAAAVILAPIAPILVAGGVCAVAEHAMTGKDRERADAVDEELLASGPSYATFLDRFGRYDFHTEKGSYQIREYLATDCAFFTGGDFFYDVGFRDGKPVWVTYRNDAVRFHAVRYWNTHR